MQSKIVLGIDAQEQAKVLENVPEGADKKGWVFTARGERGWELRRIPYLAELRNRVMEPLLKEARGVKFDKVLWINDVVFTVSFVYLSRDVSFFHLFISSLLADKISDRGRNDPPLNPQRRLRSRLLAGFLLLPGNLVRPPPPSPFEQS